MEKISVLSTDSAVFKTFFFLWFRPIPGKASLYFDVWEDPNNRN